MSWWSKPGTRKPKAWLIALTLFAMALIAFAAMRMRGSAVEVATVESGPIQHSLVFTARVAGVARTDIASTLTARVEKILVREGDQVKSGEVLIVLDDTDLRAQLSQANAATASAQTRLQSQVQLSAPVANQALAQSRANRDFAQTELARTQSLHAKGFVGDAKLQEAERGLATAQATYNQALAQANANAQSGSETQSAQARVREAQAAAQVISAKLTQTRIIAPADGRVIARDVELGDVAQPGKKLLTLALAGETRLIAQIDEKNLGLVREGMRAVASADAFPETKFDAELFYLAPSVDLARGTVEARLRVPNPPPPPTALRDDMTVSVEVVVAKKTNGLTIPPAALRDDGARKRVLVVRDGVAQEQVVSTGIQSLQRVEITQGLRAGDHVVLDPRVNVGQRIRPIAVSAKAKTTDVPFPMQ